MRSVRNLLVAVLGFLFAASLAIAPAPTYAAELTPGWTQADDCE